MSPNSPPGPPLAGKIAVVTGAAGAIGRAIGRRFLRAGAKVIAADLRPPQEEGMLFFRADVGREEQARALAAFAVENGGFDILVNCAGAAIEKSIEDTEVEEWERVMAVNARGVFLATKHAFAPMRAGGGGAIVNIGSIEARGANPLHAAYAASKGAAHSLTRNIASEGGAWNIRCNAVAPGWIDTPFNEELIARYPRPDEARAEIRALHPVGRIGTPDDVAALALWLASDEAAFVSGQIYVLDGGRTARLPLPRL